MATADKQKGVRTSTNPPAPAVRGGAASKRKRGLGTFLKADHAYVFLGTSVLALCGVWLSMRPRSAMSFLAPYYGLEVVLYWVLVAWLAVSALALITKLRYWDDYRAKSPFAAEAARPIERYLSYVVWAIVLVFFLDRAVMGFANTVSVAISSDSKPQGDDLAAVIFIVYECAGIYEAGIATTIELAVFGTIIAFFLALILVFLRIQVPDRQDNDFVRFLKIVGAGFARVYSTIVRGTPMMVQGLVIFFGIFGILRNSGLTTQQANAIWSTFVAGLVVVSLNSTAYMMEVLRGGIEAVDPGQMEAARSLGLSQWQAMSKVVIPQGIKNSIPALSNELVINIKDSSVLSGIGVFDLMFASNTAAGIYYTQTPVYFFAAAIYLLLTYVASKLLNLLSRRLGAGSVDTTPSSN